MGHKAVWINDSWGLWKNKKGNMTSHEFRKKSFQFCWWNRLTFYTLFCVCSLWSKRIFSLDKFLTVKKRKYIYKWNQFNVKDWLFHAEIILINKLSLSRKYQPKPPWYKLTNIFPCSNWRQIKESRIMLGVRLLCEAVASRKMKL